MLLANQCMTCVYVATQSISRMMMLERKFHHYYIMMKFFDYINNAISFFYHSFTYCQEYKTFKKIFIFKMISKK